MSKADFPYGTHADNPYWTPLEPRKRLYEVTVTILVEAADHDDAIGELAEGEVIELVRIEERINE